MKKLINWESNSERVALLVILQWIIFLLVMGFTNWLDFFKNDNAAYLGFVGLLILGVAIFMDVMYERHRK